MAKYTYAGDFINPAEHLVVVQNEADDVKEGDEPTYIIGVKDYCQCGSPCCSKPLLGVHPHTAGKVFEDEDDAYEWIESLRERFEEDYDDYLQENSYEIRRMELYEQFRNEQ